MVTLTPGGVRVDPAGNLLIADVGTQRIWRAGVGGLLTAVAGSTRGFSGDGGPATDARLSLSGRVPMALDGAGQLFVLDGNRVRRVDVRGVITTVPGRGYEGTPPPPPPEGAPATFVPLTAYDIAVRGGDLYLADARYERIRKVSGVALATPPSPVPAPALRLTASSWGHNGYGQLEAAGLTGVVTLAGGGFHTLALRSDGTAWSWGLGHAGQLGTGAYVQTGPARQVSGLGPSGDRQEVTAVAAGTYHSLALRSDGTVWAWGYNGAGQLGNGTTNHVAVPVQVPELTSVVAIAAGSLHSLALRADGTVWAWGLNHVGQLGSGAGDIALKPVQVPGVTGARSIAAGWSHSFAVRSDGSVAAWGWNTFGQLGDGTTLDRRTPVTVSGLPAVRSVTAGVGHSVAVATDGSVWTWGLNNFGQLARTAPVVSAAPAKVPGMTGIRATTAGGHHTLALRPDGTGSAWGWNDSGQLGGGIPPGTGSIAAGYAHTAAGAP